MATTSETVTTSTTAQTVALTTAAGAGVTTVTVINLSATAAEYVSVTTANGAAPTTAVIDADDTIPVLAGAMVSIALGGKTTDTRVSVIAATGTPDVAIVAS